MLDTEKIIANFYNRGSKSYNILLTHGIQVALKAIEILNSMSLSVSIDRNFIIEASILHDIGICMTSAESIGCFGSLPYLCHGVEGRKMLDSIGMNKHGLICERHIGMGIKSDDIIRMKLPLPVRNMIPLSIEEKLICYSDKFFSKGQTNNEKNIYSVVDELAKHGTNTIIRFFAFHDYFID